MHKKSQKARRRVLLSIKISFRVNNYKAYMYLMTDKAYKTVTRYAVVLAFSSPGTFGVFQSQDFLIPGLVQSRDFFVPRTFSVSRSCPVLSHPRTFPGLPGTGKSCCHHYYAGNDSGHIKLSRLNGMQLIQYKRFTFYRSSQGSRNFKNIGDDKLMWYA